MYFIVPAYFANMAPVIANKLGILKSTNKPIEQNIRFWDGKSLFGKNKTYRGFIVGIISGIILAYIQMLLYNIQFFKLISIIDYSNPLLVGFLLGAGAITGDLIESFFKRRININPGSKFIPLDQTDFVLGAYLFTYPLYAEYISMYLFMSSILVSFFLHIIVNHMAFYLKVRKEKW
jgi:CDP-2,3-bis-(O-geranylgeranyl)-sn-glycerol synthase